MMYIVFIKNGIELEKRWHVGEKPRVDWYTIDDLNLVQADGDELQFVTNAVSNLVHLNTFEFPVQKFRGETAKFIVENLVGVIFE